MHVIRDLLHFALIHYALENLLPFVLKSYHILHWILKYILCHGYYILWCNSHTVLCKCNTNVFCRNSGLFLDFWWKNIEFLMEANFRWKATIICDTYCFQLCEFSNEDSLRTKIDFAFLSKNSLCLINDFEHLSEILLFISSAQKLRFFSA